MIISNIGELFAVENSDLDRRGNLVIPEGVTTIASKAMRKVSVPICRVILPKSLKRIRKEAFKGVNFKKIHFPKNLRYIETGAFAGSTVVNITSDEERDTFIRVGEGAFEGCENLLRAEIPFGVIPKRCFRGCKKLHMQIPVYVTAIEDEAFAESGMRLVALGQRHEIREIGYRAFAECRRLEIVSIDTAKSIEMADIAFTECQKLCSVFINEANMGEMTFRGCQRLQEVRTRNVQDLPYGTFEGCRKLSIFEDASNSIIRIGDFAFSGTAISEGHFNNVISSERCSFSKTRKVREMAVI